MIIETKEGLEFYIPEEIRDSGCEDDKILHYVNCYNIKITFYRESVTPKFHIIHRGLGGIISDADFDMLKKELIK
jgi:hypothetical protein